MNEPTMITGIEELGIFERDADAWVCTGCGKSYYNLLTLEYHFCDDCGAIILHDEERSKSRKNAEMLMILMRAFNDGGEQKPKPKEYVYAFEFESGRVKIGRTITKNRHSQVQSGNAEKIVRVEYIECSNSALVEKDVHTELLGSRLHREIFDISFNEACSCIIDAAQRLNAALIRAGVSGDERTRILESNYQRKEREV